MPALARVDPEAGAAGLAGMNVAVSRPDSVTQANAAMAEAAMAGDRDTDPARTLGDGGVASLRDGSHRPLVCSGLAPVDAPSPARGARLAHFAKAPSALHAGRGVEHDAIGTRGACGAIGTGDERDTDGLRRERDACGPSG